MNRRFRAGLALSLAVVAFGSACSSDASTTPGDPDGSFAKLQSAVFSKSCAVSGCHTSSGAAAAGNLNLSGGASYGDLINISATQTNAKRDGMRRVLPFNADSSLLYQKLLAISTHPDYGNAMPSGAEAISAGQLEFVRQWITAGAPHSGDVADASLLSSTAAQSTAAFVALPPPAVGAGFQVHVDPFSVSNTYERELFVYRKLGNAAPVYVNRIETLMRHYSHHFVLYSFATGGFPCAAPPTADVVRDIRNADGSMNLINMLPMACHVFVGGSMNERGDYVFPDGVALELPAQMGIDVNVHYVDRTAGPVTGEAFANLYTVPEAQVVKKAHTLNMSNTSFSLPAQKVTTVEKTFTVSQVTTVFALTSHMHQLGEKFQIRVVGGSRDGELLYENTDWEHPAMLTLATPLVLQPGQGLKSVVTWNNTTANTVSFGLMSTNEMAIIFGYYY